jgi:hypothetical protein
LLKSFTSSFKDYFGGIYYSVGFGTFGWIISEALVIFGAGLVTAVIILG